MTQYREANLKTVEWGVANVPNTALLVHGLTGRGESFEALAEKLDPAGGIPGGPWRFLAPDLRGRGDSKEIPGGKGGIPEHARDLLALMDREELERVVFVGHSMGAMIGVYLAAHFPERIRGLVLVDGGSEVTEEIDALVAPSVERLEGTYPSREAYLEYLKSQPVFEDRWDERLERYFAGDVQPGEDGRWYPKADLETVEKDRAKMQGLPLSELWSSIRCPTLILLSTVGLANPEEGFILPPNDARRMQRAISDSSLVEVENTNHYDILYSAPPATVEAIKDFLGQRDAGRARAPRRRG
jgi:pimeloyl-ACP methyl ester carboxylesterase